MYCLLQVLMLSSGRPTVANEGGRRRGRPRADSGEPDGDTPRKRPKTSGAAADDDAEEEEEEEEEEVEG